MTTAKYQRDQYKAQCDKLLNQREELVEVLKWWTEYAINNDVPFDLISKTREVIAENNEKSC